MPLRRRAALVVAAATTLTALTAPIALADTTAPPAATSPAAAPSGDMYGKADATYDGVWRQSYALLALKSAGVTPGRSAVSWLLAEQCADGGFPSYRANTGMPCDPKTEDTNATGIAVQAIQAMELRGNAVQRAVSWLHRVQNADGGWSYNPGGASDPDSTGVVIGALVAAGGSKATGQANSKGKTPAASLLAAQFGCSAEPADRGSFGYPANGKLTVNAKATADAVRGAAGAGFVVTAPTVDSAPAAPDCAAGKNAYDALQPAVSARAGAAWLVAQLTVKGGHLTAVTPGAPTPTPDYGTTADAVVALAATGELTTAKAAYAWLAANSSSWSRGNPAALSQLILAAHATGADPRSANGTDLVRQLVALGPAPAEAQVIGGSDDKPGATEKEADAKSKAAEKKDSSSSSSTWIIVGVVFVASAGAGLLISGRKRRQG